MRIPFPERVNLSYVLLFASGLCGMEFLEGTSPAFCACVFCFILIAGVAFNIAGGIPYPSGAYVGFNAIFSVIFPQTIKVLLREPADSNLRAPVRTMEVYLLGMVAMLIAAMITRQFRPRKAFISDMLPERSLRGAYIGCGVFSVLISLYLTFGVTSGGNGSFTSFLMQANRFPLLTIVLGIIYTVYRTSGKRSVSGPLLGMIFYSAIGGILSFSKEQLISPFFTWAVTMALVGFQLNWKHLVMFGVGTFVLLTYLVPYAQYGRGFDQSVPRPQLALYLLTHMSEVREADEANSGDQGPVHYYNNQYGLLHRFDLMSTDDALIDLTQRNGNFGYRPIVEGFENVIPHVLFPGKPTPAFGNVYAHEINILAPNDPYTGVSFTPSADAYHEGGAQGIVLVETAVLALVFFILDAFIGDVRRNPVGLLTTLLVVRGSVEGALWGAPLLIGQFLFTNILAVYICAYVLPLIGSIFSKSPSTAPGAQAPPSRTYLRPPNSNSALPVSTI